MTKKRLAIIGKGTAGSVTLAHFVKWLNDYEIVVYHDSNTPTQAVGEGATLNLPNLLRDCLDFRHTDLEKIDGSFKSAILKENWGTKNEKFFHDFIPPYISYHFNAIGLQNYIFNEFKEKYTLIDRAVINHNEIDADYIVDCSGKPKTFDDFHISNYIPVNSVYVTQCFWNKVDFQYTLTIARPYGWVFGIPLKNECSIGYMYNHNINTLDEIKNDVINIFKEYNLTPSDKTNSFHFKNYYRKENYTERVFYNGNASFFLEPLEATSIWFMEQINRQIYDMIVHQSPVFSANQFYNETILQIQDVIMLHYFARSKFETDFWKSAYVKAEDCINHAFLKEAFLRKIVNAINYKDHYTTSDGDYGSWWDGAFRQNLLGLGLMEYFKTRMKKNYGH